MLSINIEPEFKKHLDKKLARRMRILTIILCVMTGVLVYNMYISHIRFLLVFLGVVLGCIVGFLAGRMFLIKWREEDSKIISNIDLLGGIVLAIYITVSIARSWIFAHWFKGLILTSFTFSFIEGAMIGRLLSMRFNIKKILSEQGKTQ